MAIAIGKFLKFSEVACPRTPLKTFLFLNSLQIVSAEKNMLKKNVKIQFPFPDKISQYAPDLSTPSESLFTPFSGSNVFAFSQQEDITSSSHWRYYAEACNDRVASPSSLHSAFVTQKRRCGGEPMATVFDLTRPRIELETSDSDVFSFYANRPVIVVSSQLSKLHPPPPKFSEFTPVSAISITIFFIFLNYHQISIISLFF